MLILRNKNSLVDKRLYYNPICLDTLVTFLKLKKSQEGSH
jgi:hypothetical protein